MNERDIKVILALADCNMVVTKTAKVMYVHHNTVRYYIGKIKRKTGLDPTRFYDLCKLVEMVSEEKEKL